MLAPVSLYIINFNEAYNLREVPPMVLQSDGAEKGSFSTNNTGFLCVFPKKYFALAS
jgi:hypothetical protein